MPIKRCGSLIVILVALVVAALGLWHQSRPSPSPSIAIAETGYQTRLPGRVTFNKEIAPIIYKNCSVCHRPGQTGPFDLLTYRDVARRAKEIVEVAQSGYMPPWLPEPGYAQFSNERRLSIDEIGLIAQWAAEGCPEGKPSDLPSPPQWTEGWALGTPDLVIEMPKPYQLASDGKDVYRNFVMRVPIGSRRFVHAVEFRPANPKVVHHAFLLFDRTRTARRLAEKEDPPGFDGMRPPEGAIMPSGQFLGWQPGTLPNVAPPGLAWPLERDTDLVLQLHLRPSGKPEQVRSSVGFYFTQDPPTNTPFRLNLSYYKIDIPPGEKTYTIEQQYRLPVDLHLLLVSAHAHYLGKELEGFALLPDGSKKWLLRIKQWDFNWQNDYRYAEPVFLPRGTTLAMRFTYDNSAENIRNPHQPPQRVQYGLQTTDEMGELWFQTLLTSTVRGSRKLPKTPWPAPNLGMPCFSLAALTRRWFMCRRLAAL